MFLAISQGLDHGIVTDMPMGSPTIVSAHWHLVDPVWDGAPRSNIESRPTRGGETAGDVPPIGLSSKSVEVIH